MDSPAELAGYSNLRFQGTPALFWRNGNMTIFVMTTDGRLAQIFDTNRWNLDFPAELAGQGQ